ncbi:MAG: twin transmembrane helix small protein [Rhodobacteraceae bacterium]|nr:twin transmembrane helix small protein [Paracoccaceae bacterium]
MTASLFYLIILACITVVIILMIGIGGFAKGGAFNQKYANKLMRLRLLAQFIAVVMIAIFMYARQSGG